MANLSGFDATKIQPAESFEPIPAGWYNAVIEDSESRTTKAGTGEYLNLTLRVLDGPQVNRKVWAILNLKNPNPVAVEIAERDLSSICHATGVLRPIDSSELHNKPLMIHVGIEESPGYSPRNKVKGYKSVQGSVNTATPEPKAAEAPAAVPESPGNGSTPPWAR